VNEVPIDPTSFLRGRIILGLAQADGTVSADEYRRLMQQFFTGVHLASDQQELLNDDFANPKGSLFLGQEFANAVITEEEHNLLVQDLLEILLLHHLELDEIKYCIEIVEHSKITPQLKPVVQNWLNLCQQLRMQMDAEFSTDRDILFETARVLIVFGHIDHDFDEREVAFVYEFLSKHDLLPAQQQQIQADLQTTQTLEVVLQPFIHNDSKSRWLLLILCSVILMDGKLVAEEIQGIQHTLAMLALPSEVNLTVNAYLDLGNRVFESFEK
jgi:uncharacterized membrane protein YebE (DUF533 family)